MCASGSHIPLSSPNKVTPGAREDTLHTQQRGGCWFKSSGSAIVFSLFTLCLNCMFIHVHLCPCTENQRKKQGILKKCLGKSLAQLTALTSTSSASAPLLPTKSQPRLKSSKSSECSTHRCLCTAMQ